MSIYIHQIFPLNDPELPIFISEDSLPRSSTGVAMHWHEDFEILYTTVGTGELVIDGATILLPVGSIAIIPSGALHSSKASAADTAESFNYIVLEIQKIFFIQNRLDLDDIAFCTSIEDDELSRMIVVILQEYQQEGEHYKAMLRAKIMEFIIKLCRNYTVVSYRNDNREPNKLKMTKSVLSYIRQNYRQPISIDQIARETSTSKYYLCRIFKEVTGKTIINYINYLRCQYARSLLQTGNYTVLEVLSQSGFNDPPYFSQVYKRHMGIPPSFEKLNR